MVNAIFLIFEMLAFLQILHSFNTSQLRFSMKLVILLLTDIVVFSAVFYKLLDEKMQVIVYILLFVYIFTEFKTRFSYQIVYIIFTCIIIMILQISFNYLVFFIKTYWIKYLIINGLLLLSAVAITRLLDLSKIKSFFGEKKQMLIAITLELAFLCVAMFIIFKINKSFSLLECLLISMLAAFLIVFIVNWRSEKKILMAKEREIKLIGLCNDSFENLLNDVRARQHQFDNSLDVIYSMHYVYETYDELVEHQQEYSRSIIINNRHNRLLTAKALPAIIGYLYHKIQMLENQGIHIEYKVNMPDVKELNIVFDIIDMLGILLDNAKEAMENCNMDNPKIYLELKSLEENIYIEIRNISPYVKHDEIIKFFKRGYSSKGLGRGIGLYNLKSLVKSHNGEIFVENKNIQEDNWLSFSIKMKRESGE